MKALNGSIRVRLLAIAAVPLVGMAMFATLSTADRWQDYRQARAVEAAAIASTTAGALVHELQRERGMSSGFVGSQGATFGPDLDQQRPQTDAALAAFSGLDLGAVDETARAPLQQAADSLRRLGPLRTEVTSLTASQPVTVAYFTDAISLLLTGVGHATRIADGDLGSVATAYVDVLQGKERFGQLRAQLSAVFASDTWQEGQYVKVAGLTSARDAFLAAARTAASPDIVSAIDAAVASEKYAAATAMGKTALARPDGGFDTGAESWFSTATAGIDELKAVEDMLAARLAGTAATRADDALRAFWSVVAAALAVGLVTVLLTLWVTGRMVRRISAAADALRAAAEGRLTVRVADSTHDEIGAMAESTNAALSRMSEVLGLVEGRATTLADASDRLRAASARMSSAAGETDDLTRNTAEATTELVDAIGLVRSAGGETAEALSQIEDSNVAATATTREAVTAATNAQDSVRSLQQAVDEIITVAAAITSVARQTNLLALNATIEAQRAGSHGRGFAVVASEVKQLSRETAESTEQVRQRVLAVQDGMGRVSAEIGAMAETVARIDVVQDGISSAVAGQRAAAEHVDAALGGVAHTTTRISDAVKVAHRSAESAAQTAQATAELADEMTVTARELRTALERFDFTPGG